MNPLRSRGVFACFGSSHGFLSMIFGFLGENYIGIVFFGKSKIFVGWKNVIFLKIYKIKILKIWKFRKSIFLDFGFGNFRIFEKFEKFPKNLKKNLRFLCWDFFVIEKKFKLFFLLCRSKISQRFQKSHLENRAMHSRGPYSKILYFFKNA